MYVGQRITAFKRPRGDTHRERERERERGEGGEGERGTKRGKRKGGGREGVC